MAHRSHIIATACEVALDRRIRGDEAKVEAARTRVGGSEMDMAAAEWWCLWAVLVVEELPDGAHQLRGVIERHRLAQVSR
jgi:hypothetical protein